MSEAPADAFFEVNGRRWRRTDPHIPEALRQALVNELMSARRAVGAATNEVARRAARRRVHDAKVALGERGRAWWLASTATQSMPRIEAALRALLRSRPEGTIRPSEVARIADGASWRRLLPAVRRQAVDLAAAGRLTILDRQGHRAPGEASRGGLCYGPSASLARDVL